MATILSEYVACDGYNINCETSLGPRTYHFLSQPANAQYEVDLLEQNEVELVNMENAVLTLEQARMERLNLLHVWYANISSQGVNVGGTVLASTLEDQNRFTSLITLEHLALTLGARQITDISGFADINGQWHAVSLSELFSIMLQYAQVCSTWSYQYSTALEQIHNASSVEELESIEWL